MDNDSTEYLKEQLYEAFLVIDSCLASYYQKNYHMYKPLAAQLRLIFCDSNRKQDNSLITRVYPNLVVSRIKSIEWDKKAEINQTNIEIISPSNGEIFVSTMPFDIMQYCNGLAVANLIPCPSKDMLLISKWVNQCLTYSPTPLTIKEIIRTIADKGGGAHIDSNPSEFQKAMSQLTCVGRSYDEMFIIAMARFAQNMGMKIFDYQGVQVPNELISQQAILFRLTNIAYAGQAGFLKRQYPLIE